MPRGTLKGSFSDRGFTFVSIEPDTGQGDVFLHISRIRDGESPSHFVRGAQVEFEVERVRRGTEDKLQARDARLISDIAAPAPSATVSAADHEGTVKFWSPLSYGFVVDGVSGEELYVHASSVLGGYLRQGDAVRFAIEETGDRRQAVNVSVVGWNPTGDAFADTLDMGNPRWATQLADLAEPENWNYQERPSKDQHQILRSYMKYTFLRLNELEDHVIRSNEGKVLSFNTGLVTPFQEEIFALFRARPGGETGPPWVLRSFEKASGPTFLRLFGGRVPPLARYFDDPTQLVFDTRLELRVNVEHVPHDQDRFPATLNSLSPQDLAALVNAKAPDALDRVRRNYKTAIPQFYRDSRSGEGKMQLLLPVALLRRDNVELALAVDRLPSGVYLGRTVLTLDWAYNNARLLTRPDSDWLRP